MKTEKQKISEQQEDLKRIVSEMPVVERAAAMALVNLGNAVAALVTRRDWQTIAEMNAVCNEVFEQARMLKIEEKFHTVQ